MQQCWALARTCEVKMNENSQSVDYSILSDVPIKHGAHTPVAWVQESTDCATETSFAATTTLRIATHTSCSATADAIVQVLGGACLLPVPSFRYNV